MAEEIASAYVSIGASTKGLGKSVKAELGGIEGAAATTGGRVSSSIGGAFKAAAGIAAASFGAAKIGQFFKGAVDQASDLNEAGTALTQVFGDAVGTINNFAKGGASAFGQNELAVKNAAQTFGVYGKAAGLASTANAKFSTDLVSLSTDLASFYNTDPSQAVEALAAGLRGEAEPLRKFGVLLDDATLKAKAMEMGIYDGTGSLTQQQKVLAAQASIMEQTAVAQGDFARTSGGLANQQRVLAATWQNFTGTVGAALLPLITSAVAKLNELAGPALTAVSNGFARGVDAISGFFTSFGHIDNASDLFDAVSRSIMYGAQVLVKQVPKILETLLPRIVESIVGRAQLVVEAISSIVTTIVAMLPTLLPMVVQAFLTLFNGIIQAVTTILPQVVMAITTLIPQLVTTLIALVPTLLQGALTLFTSVLTALTQIIPVLLTAVIGLVPQVVEALVSLLPDLITGALDLFMGLIAALTEIVPQLLDTVLGILPGLIDTLVSMLPGLIQGAIALFIALVKAVIEIAPKVIRSILAMLPDILDALLRMLPEVLDGAIQLFTGIVDALPEILPDLIAAVLDLLPEIVGTLIGMIPDLIEAGVDLIGGLVSGLWKAAGSVGDALIKIAKDAIGGFLGFLGIRSPSRLFKGFGVNTGEGYVQGLDAMGKPITKAMKSMVDTSEAERAIAALGATSPTVKAINAASVTANAVPGAAGGDSGTVTLSDASIKALIEGILRGASDVADGRIRILDKTVALGGLQGVSI